MSINITKYVNSYEFDFTLPGSNEVIMFKPITTGQLKKLIVYENETNPETIENVLDTLISDCVVSEGFDINKLYLEDRFALLVEINKKSKGEEYNFIYKCPSCGKQQPQSIDFNELQITKKSNDKNTFKISDSLSVDIDSINRGEQKEILKKIAEKKIDNDSLRDIETALYTYAMSMRTFHTPEGDTDDVSLEDKVSLFDNAITDTQYKELKKIFDNMSFGIDFRFDLNCECGYKNKLDIPLNNFFS